MQHILEAKGISKKYGDFQALHNIDLKIPKQSIFGIMGPNGAGKTTFIRIINQITMPDQGEVLFDGNPIQPDDIQQIGYLPEERGLYKSMKVGEQVLYLAQLKGLTKKEAKDRLYYWFEQLEIDDWFDKKVNELSKGMAQKIQFIVTVIHQPKLLILDEPFSGFDPVNANLIRKQIIKLKNEGATILLSTHRLENIEEMCDYIALLNKSEKLLDGKIDDVRQDFRTQVFQLSLKTDQKEELESHLKSKFELLPADFKTIAGNWKANVKLPESIAPNQFLKELMPLGTITHFNEVMPSVNEIFIKSVAEHA